MRPEALEAPARELDHRLGEVDSQIGARVGLQHVLGDPSRAAAHVEHARTLIRAHSLDCELAPAEQPGAQQPDEQPLVLVEVIELLRLGAEPVTDPLRRLR